MRLNFVKMSGAGNDFIVFNNLDGKLSFGVTNLVRKICRRRYSIGADGVLLLERSDNYDFRMRYFNADGGEVEMCGNGGRCIARFAYEEGIVDKEMVFESVAGVHRAKIIGDNVKLGMTEPADLELDFELIIDGKRYNACFLNTGVPHVIIFVDDLKNFDVHSIGRKIRYHDRFQPGGTNANFVKVVNQHTIQIRTYERGVEAETLACGTGSTAGAIISYLKEKITEKPVNVLTQGGFELKIYFDKTLGKVTNVYLQGDAEITFTGTVEWEK